jgi:hypothetical protein
MVTINPDGRTNIQNISTKPKIFLVFLYICAMETIKPKRGRKKLPENQRKRLMSAYLTDEQKNLILAKYGSLSDAVRTEILPKLYLLEFIAELENPKDGHNISSRD